MSPFRGFLCCQGTMTESASKLAEAAYHTSSSSDNHTIYVSQFISSAVTVAGVHIEQVSAFPESLNRTTSLGVSCATNKSVVLKLRVPFWASSGRNSIRLDGTLLLGGSLQRNGSFIPLRLDCSPQAQQLHVHFPQSLRIERINDDRPQFAGVFAVLYGPTLLAALSNTSHVPAATLHAPVTSWVQRRALASCPPHVRELVGGRHGLAFLATNGSAELFWMVPIAAITTQYYAMYLNATDADSPTPTPTPTPHPPPPHPPPPPPRPAPSPPGPPCAIGQLTNDTAKLNNYCRTHTTIKTGQLCSYDCGGGWRADHCMSSGRWEKSVQELCEHLDLEPPSPSSGGLAMQPPKGWNSCELPPCCSAVPLSLIALHDATGHCTQGIDLGRGSLKLRS
jgi:hypothetical protein